MLCFSDFCVNDEPGRVGKLCNTPLPLSSLIAQARLGQLACLS